MKKYLSVMLLLMASTTMLFAQGGKETKSSGAEEATHLKIIISVPRFKDQFTSYFDQFCVQYEQETGKKVTYELELPTDNTSSILKTRLSSGDPVDIFAVHALRDLPQYAEAGYVAELDGEEFTTKLFSSALAATSYKGHPRGIPLETMTWGYLYNKDMFAEIGITTQEQMPQTLSEMQDVCDKLEAKGYTPFVLPYKDIPWTFWPLQLSKEAITRVEVPDWFERMNKGEASWSEIPHLFDALKLINANGTKHALDTDSGDGCANFALNKGAMLVTGPWYAEAILDVNPDFNLGVAALPVSEDPDECLINQSASTMLCINEKSDNKDAAIALLNYMLDDKDSYEFYTSCMFNPVTEAQQEKMEISPWVADGQEWLNAGKFYMDDQNVPSTCSEDTQKLLQAWYAGTLTDEEWIVKADKLWIDSNNALGEQKKL